MSCGPCQPGVTGDAFTVDPATNRLTAKNGFAMTYDAAGNQTNDATGNRWYDGENRMKQAQQGAANSYYVYDADGRRVRRIVGGVETWMIYGLGGELLAEYPANGAVGSPQKEYGYRDGQLLIVAQTAPVEIRWLVADHLGSPRINVRGTGADGGSLASVTRHDYLPFGEELISGVGIRGSGYSYEPPADGVRQKFGSKERDTETGLDYFGARYFGSIQGRFTSPDDFWKDSQVSDPQSWNKYTYVRNNPLKYVDPTGEKADVTIQTDEENKRGTITIKATVGVWTGDSKNISSAALSKAGADLKSSIEKGWNGQFVQDGITYTVTAEITVNTYSDENAAINSGAQNVIEMVNGDVGPNTLGQAGRGGLISSYDAGRINIAYAGSRTAAHEFEHLLGIGHGDNQGGNLMTQTAYSSATVMSGNDFSRGFGGAINSHRNSSRRYERLEDAEPYKHAQTRLGDRYYSNTS